jgi:hypothetical protein
MSETSSFKPKPSFGYTGISAFFTRYFWVIIRNLVGWVLIISAIVVGGVFPGPLGTPIFLIGFSLITFPGKRRLTSRVLRGIPMDLFTHRMRSIRGAIAVIFPPLIVWLIAHREHSQFHPQRIGLWPTIAVYCMAVAGTWLLTFWFMRGLNLIIHFLPRVRRNVRPWLKKHGINLLPPRRRRRSKSSPMSPQNEEILAISSERVVQARGTWRAMRRWIPFGRGS